MNASTLEKSSKGRTGQQATIYSVKRDPAFDKNDFIVDKDNKKFGFVNESAYKGHWNNNKKEGFGVEIKSDGTKYEGEWKENMRHGLGTVYVQRNNKYTKQYAGEFCRNQKDGYGVFTYEDGSVYKGNWFKNMRSGHGRMEYKSGDIYVGEWAKDIRHGSAHYYHTNGNIYEGHFMSDMKEGPGRFYYAATNKVHFRNSLFSVPSHMYILLLSNARSFVILSLSLFHLGLRRGMGRRFTQMRRISRS